jgi:hypothetical protein
MEPTIQERKTAISPNQVAMALFAAGRCVLHVDGRHVTCSIDGQYVSGVAEDWPGVVAVVDTAVHQFVCAYMMDVMEAHMNTAEISEDAARYFGISGDGVMAWLRDWAAQAKLTKSIFGGVQ